jgi:hypothetical protein
MTTATQDGTCSNHLAQDTALRLTGANPNIAASAIHRITHHLAVILMSTVASVIE